MLRRMSATTPTAFLRSLATPSGAPAVRPKVAIIGGVAGGASAAARLRRLAEYADIAVYDKGKFVSFANCGLPYYVGDVITAEEKLVVATSTLFHVRTLAASCVILHLT